MRNVWLGLQDKALIKLKGHKTKYAFIDQGKNLRGRDVNLTLVWSVMPKVGERACMTVRRPHRVHTHARMHA